ncbi:Hypothetical predicted protein, partial [Paramuricea clavata]
CLEGEAAVKVLGYSEVACEAAKNRLIRKYGGVRRNVQAKELERFADILERTVVTLKENKRESDLKAGTLYGIVLEKVPEMLLSQYYRWLKEQKKEESLETLNCWIAEKTEYQTHAAKRKRGFSRGREDRKGDEKSGRRITGVDSKNRLVQRGLVTRSGKWLNVLDCANNALEIITLEKTVSEVEFAQSQGATRITTNCYMKYQTKNHQSKTHHPPRRGMPVTKPLWKQSKNMKSVALRTVPIILKNDKKRLLVNCFLDEGSETTYVNEDVIEQLGLREEKERVTVQVANPQQVTFMSATFEIGIESVDGKVNSVIVPKTSQKICGRMKPTNWVKIKDR